MGKKYKSDANVEKEEYSFEMLQDDIFSDLEYVDILDGKDGRETRLKLIVVQMLINLAAKYKTRAFQDGKRLSDAIESEVNGNEMLSGYIFFVSQNRQFDYSWNYMRKSKTYYIEFLADSVRFLNNVIVDINVMAGKFNASGKMHVVFHDIFDVEPVVDGLGVKTHVLWGNFHRMATVGNDYDVSVKLKDSVLKVGCRKKPSDFVDFVDAAIEMAENSMAVK